MIYLAVSIDVEPDCSNNWNYSNPLTFNGVTIGVKKILQPLFNEYGIKPTYLINNVVLEDAESVAVFNRLKGEFEMGTHLHCEFIEPQKIHHDYAGKAGRANQCALEPEVEMAKMRTITELFKQNFGYAPRSFRAGRFSAGKNTIKCLNELGYWVDSSVTPGLVWNDKTREFPVDYSKSAFIPYFTDGGVFPQKSVEHKILEVPISIVPSKRFLFLRHNLWLRPFYSTLKEMKEIVSYIQQNAEGDIFLNMMFHNVEILPSLSPYCKTQKDCDNYLSDLELFFKYCTDLNISSVSLSDICEKYRGKD